MKNNNIKVALGEGGWANSCISCLQTKFESDVYPAGDTNTVNDDVIIKDSTNR